MNLKTTTTPVVISPRLTALVIIDMQNFFLSTALGRDPDSAGNKAKAKLLEHAIPAARAAGIRIVWLNWGLTDEEIDEMPPGTRRAFGFEASLNDDAIIDAHGVNEAAAKHVLHESTTRTNEATTTASLAKIATSQLTENGKPKRLYRGLGSEIGPVELSDGTTVDGGRLLMRDTWNASLPSSLLTAYKTGADIARPNDVWIHKNRMSGLWEENGSAIKFLNEEGIRTLIFSGVNTDQVSSSLLTQVLIVVLEYSNSSSSVSEVCKVPCFLTQNYEDLIEAGSLQDAYMKGWDCILLSDASGTTSPSFAQDCIEYNSARTWGFVTDCRAFKTGVEDMIGKSVS